MRTTQKTSTAAAPVQTRRAVEPGPARSGVAPMVLDVNEGCSAQPVDLPQARTLAGQGAMRPRPPGRPAGLSFGAALPSGHHAGQDNAGLYMQGTAAAESTSARTASLTLSADTRTLVSRVLAAAENSDPDGDPSGVYVLRDGKNRRKQITLGIGFTEDSGNLRKVVEAYVAAGGQFADQMRPFIDRIGATPNLSGNAEFKGLLKTAGRQDPLFAEVQREKFVDIILEPARDFCEREGLEEPLSFLVVADSYLHSGGILSFLRNRFPERSPADGGNERVWIEQYVDTRHDWLANHSNALLRNTIYRTRALTQQIDRGNWDLLPPIEMHGITVGLPASMDRPLPITGSVGAGGQNRPGDVRLVKARLNELGFGGIADSDSADAGFVRAIRLFQSIITGRQRVEGDGRVDVGFGTQSWLEAENAPRWQEMPVGDRDGGFFNYEVATQPGDHHDYGTNWLADMITSAGQQYFDEHRSRFPGSNPILVNDASLPDGHDTNQHAGHETGMSADLRVPNTDGDQNRGTVWSARDYDRPAMRAMLKAFAAQENVGRVFFNDPVLIREGLCTSAGGHDNHVHVEVVPPARQAPVTT
ncbi:MAG: chitosanase [Deltaproteobacteria bacterium]